MPVIKKHSCNGQLPIFFVRHFCLLCLRYNMLFKAKYLPGTQNHLAAPSFRLEIYKFRHLVPASMAQPATDIHHQLLPQNWQIKFYFWLNLACSHHQFLHIRGLGTFITNSCFILCRILIRISLCLPLH